jgi:hypothetical protein
LVCITCLVALGCGDAREPTPADSGLTSANATSAASATDSATGADDGPRLDVGGGMPTGGNPGDDPGCQAENIDPPNATLTGTVFAPNMEIPISGALVYVGNAPAEPVPDGVYCAECVELPCDANFVLTQPDGTFELPAVAGTGRHLVVQKGQFLRDVQIDIAEGTSAVAVDQTNLPGEWNPDAGMWIPRIAVYDADPDQVYNVLAKFGLGEVSAGGVLVPGTERFTLINGADNGSFMDDLPGMRQFHIIFVPCASTKYWLGAPTVPPLRAQNIRDYVAGGGKWYATDHSNEYIEEPFPSYQEFHAPAMPDLQPAYDVTGNVDDPELLAWLQALPPALKDIGGGNPTLNALPSVQLRLNYSGIDVIHEVIVQDDEGNDVNVGPYSWVSGPCTSCSDPATSRPMAITGQWGCGRMMYSTFETSSLAHQGLNPQELVLLYMILEIGVCHETPPPPVPPVG